MHVVTQRPGSVAGLRTSGGDDARAARHGTPAMKHGRDGPVSCGATSAAAAAPALNVRPDAGAEDARDQRHHAGPERDRGGPGDGLPGRARACHIPSAPRAIASTSAPNATRRAAAGIRARRASARGDFTPRVREGGCTGVIRLRCRMDARAQRPTWPRSRHLHSPAACRNDPLGHAQAVGEPALRQPGGSRKRSAKPRITRET
jgi:hypothetical protein